MNANRRTMLTRAALSVVIGFGMASAALAQTAPKTPTPTPSPKTAAPAATAPAKPAPPPAAATAKAATPPATAPAANEGPGAWDKICGADALSGKQTCTTRFVATQPNGQIFYGVTVQKVAGVDGYSVMELHLPMGLIMPPGISMVIDGAKKATAVFVICVPQAPFLCVAQVKPETALIDALKKGKQLALLGMGPDGKEAKFDVALAGFGKALDSQGVDVAAAQAKDDELNQALQKRAAEQRQRLIDEQNKATAAK